MQGPRITTPKPIILYNVIGLVTSLKSPALSKTRLIKAISQEPIKTY